MAEALTGGPGRWALDGALASGLGNAGAVTALAGAAVWLNGIDRLFRLEFVGLVVVGVGLGPPLGAALGLALHLAWRLLQERAWWLLVPVGFPVGAIAGLLEALALRPFFDSAGDERVFVLVGPAAGGALLGLGWPVYLVLRAAEKPGWGAIALAAPLGLLVAAAPLGLVLWSD